MRRRKLLDRPIEGDWPYLWIDATYVEVRQNTRIVSVAVIIAVGVNSDGRSVSACRSRQTFAYRMLGMAVKLASAQTAPFYFGLAPADQ
jgi:Transposase, Mutator family